jgi:ABC-type multidrug transport system ATPase subunit
MMQTVYYCEEMIRLRVERVKEMLLLSGLQRQRFWFAYFVGHIAFFTVSWTISYLVMLSAGMDGVTANSAVPYFVLALCAGPTFILYGYLLSFAIDDIIQCHEWVGNWLNVSYALAWMLITFAVEPGTPTAEHMETAFCLIPGFAFYQGIGKLEVAAVNGNPFSAMDTFDPERGILRSILFLIFDFGLFCGAVYLIDTGWFSRGPKLDAQTKATVGIDSDQQELLTIIPPVVGTQAADRANNAVHAQDLSKKYALAGGGSVQAVRHTSIGVRPNSITGLLGPNGAGKSTMISMMSGIESIDSGEAWIQDASVTTNLDRARRQLGLCPQFDALLPLLTGRESLELFAAIRGVPPSLRPMLIQRTIEDMGLALKADARSGTYSGGNKRKLSVALSMIANPRVNFLDEPSTGMDPKTRRAMWEYIASKKSGRAIVLTTHSMEEADALSDQIGIMIRGELR